MPGINLDILNPNGVAAPADLKALGIDAVRLVSQIDPNGPGVHPDIEQALADFKAAGIFALVVLTGASQGRIPANHHGWVQCRNEPDGQPPASEPMTPDQYVAEFNTYSQTFPDINWIAAGLCGSDIVGYWRSVYPRLINVKGSAFHPYLKSPWQAAALAQALHDISPDAPPFMTEFNCDAAHIGLFVSILKRYTAGQYFYALSDGMNAGQTGNGPGFGLVDHADKLAAWKAAYASNWGSTISPPPGKVTSPQITYKLLSSSHYDYSATPREGFRIAGTVNHIADGYGSLFGWFSGQELSTNYWIARDGTIECYVLPEHAAYGQGLITLGSAFPPAMVAAGGGVVSSTSQGYLANCLYLSIEHEGKPADSFTAEQLHSSRWLNLWLSQQYGYPINVNTVLGHYRFDHVSRARCGVFAPEIVATLNSGWRP